jgi:zinc transporter
VPTISTYSSDYTGLIVGYRFAGGRSVEQIDGEQAIAALHEPAGGPSADGYLWLHFDLARAAAERWIHERIALPEAFFDVLRQQARTSRIEYVDGFLVAVINDFIYDFSYDSSNISTLWTSANARLVVTARRHALRSVDRLRNSIRNGDIPATSTELLVHLLRDQCDVLAEISRKSTGKIDDIEDSLLADRLELNRAGLSEMRRMLVRLQRMLAPEPATLFRMLNRPPPWMTTSDLQELRQATEEFSAALADLASLLERIKLLQEEVE